MKELFLKIEYSDLKSLEKIFFLLRDERFDYIEIEMAVSKKPDAAIVRKIVEGNSEFNETVFKNNIALPYQIHLKRSFLKAIKKNRFGLALEIDCSKKENIHRLKNKIKKLKKKKIEHTVRIENYAGNIKDLVNGLGLENVRYDVGRIAYTKDSLMCFREWMLESKAPYVSIFDDAINTVLLKTKPRDCRHSSCLGKNLYLSKDNVFSFCAFYPERTILTKLSNVNALNEVFEQGSILNVLSDSIRKRENCLKNCEHYDFCKGGCPLPGTSKCEEKEMVAFYNELSETMQTVLAGENLDKYNMHIKNAVLRYIVFNNTSI